MKGVMSFLEKAGLVRQEGATGLAPAPVPEPAIESTVLATTAEVAAQGVAVSLNLADIYTQAGVPASLYPAERLLRLVDGLRAMDEATRQLAIKAMDAADESWTIADPLHDASAKVLALGAYADGIKQTLANFDAETQNRIAAARSRQEQRGGEIRKQMAELEALLARELARGEHECATQEASLTAAREQVTRELAELARTRQALQGLAIQFGPPSTASTPE